jgi:hypothetical protein
MPGRHLLRTHLPGGDTFARMMAILTHNFPIKLIVMNDEKMLILENVLRANVIRANVFRTNVIRANVSPGKCHPG